MPQYAFELPLLQAINDWQIGSSTQRGIKLEEACHSLPKRFRSCGSRCYRKVGLTKGFVWNLIADDCLREKVSSWTVSYDVATTFKDGVPDQGSDYQGVILQVQRRGQVVINLNRLYKDSGFLEALNANRSAIHRYGDGAGRYGNSQEEVVIRVDEVSTDHVRSFGEWSSKFETLKELYEAKVLAAFGRSANATELESLRNQANRPAWVNFSATRRILARCAPNVDLLKEVKRLRELDAAERPN